MSDFEAARKRAEEVQRTRVPGGEETLMRGRLESDRRLLARDVLAAHEEIERLKEHTDGLRSMANGYRHRSDEHLAAREQAEATVKSISVMLGWENVPPRATLERDILANRKRLEATEARLRAMEERNARQAVAIEQCATCTLKMLDEGLSASPVAPSAEEPPLWVCNKCGYAGEFGPLHPDCNYYAGYAPPVEKPLIYHEFVGQAGTPTSGLCAYAACGQPRAAHRGGEGR